MTDDAGPKPREAGAEALPADIAAMSFEQALAELDRIVGRLEAGDVELEESIAIYSRGMYLRRHCEARLKAAEERIERVRLGPDGVPSGAEPFDPPD